MFCRHGMKDFSRNRMPSTGYRNNSEKKEYAEWIPCNLTAMIKDCKLRESWISLQKPVMQMLTDTTWLQQLVTVYTKPQWYVLWSGKPGVSHDVSLMLKTQTHNHLLYASVYIRQGYTCPSLWSSFSANKSFAFY